MREELYLHIAGMDLRVECGCAWTAYFLHRFLARHRVPAPRGDPGEVYAVSLEITDEAKRFPTVERAIWQGILNDGTPAVKQETKEGCVLRIGEEVAMTFDFPGRRVRCCIRERKRGGATARPQPGGYFIPLLTCLLSQERRYVIHGSAVSKAGSAAIFLGPSGAGKTTLSLHLSQRGYRFMGDDLVALKPGDHGTEVFSLLFKPKIRQGGEPKAAADLPEARRMDPCGSASAGAMVHLACPPGVRRTPAACSEQRLLERLLEQGNPPRFYMRGQEWIDFACTAASRVKGWTWGPGPLDQIRLCELEEMLS